MNLRMAKIVISFFMLFAIVLPVTAFAGEQGHYLPGVLGIRDLDQPPKGVYFAVYDIYYHAGEFDNADGDKLDSISITKSAGATKTDTIDLPAGPGGREIPVTITASAAAKLNMDLDFQFDTVIHEPAIMWAPGVKILGADYACFMGIPFGYVRFALDGDATLTASGTGTIDIGGRTTTLSKSGSIQKHIKIRDDKYGFGDLVVQPVWLQWSDYKNYSVGGTYSFYAPTGAYSEDDIANVGMGFWTQQWQAYGYYYLLGGATAFHYRTTYELHSYKYAKDVRPGQDITIEYGISQYLHERFGVGVLGYHLWQISDDAGTAAINKDVHDRVSGIGGEVNFWPMKGKLLMTGRLSVEYGAHDRFEGLVAGLHFVWAFGEPINQKVKKRNDREAQNNGKWKLFEHY